MKILTISTEQDSLILQDALFREGNEIRAWAKEKRFHENGKGIVPIVTHYEPYISWADLVVCGETDLVDDIADRVRKYGKPVMGGTKATRLLEEDRALGMSVMTEMGLAVPPWFGPFNTLDEVLAFVKQNPDRYVLKPSGQLDRDLTYVSKDADDLTSEISRWKETNVKIKKGCILQKFIPGREIAIGCFVTQGKFLSPYFVNWEHKKLLTGDLGPNTGEIATIGYWCGHKTKLGKELKKLEKWFSTNAKEYSTYFDLNFMISDDGTPYVLEPTVRIGYPTIGLQMESLGMPVGDFFYDLATGVDSLNPIGPWGALVVIYAPGFPFRESFKIHGGDQVFPFDPCCYICEMWYDGKNYRSRKEGGIGNLVAVASIGKDLTEARERVYNKIKTLDLPSKYGMRTDCGKRVQKDLDFYKPYIGLD